MSIPIKGETSSQPAPRKIEHVVDQSSHSQHGRLQHGDDLMLFIGVCFRPRIRAPALIEARGLRRSWPSTAINCSRNSEVSRSLFKLVFSHVAGFQEFVLIASSISGLDQAPVG